MGLYPSLFSNFVIPFPQNHQIRMLLLGIDLGTSSVKVSVVNAQSQQCIASAFFPETEADIISPHPGWAEQSPDQWWEYVKQAMQVKHTIHWMSQQLGLPIKCMGWYW